MTKFVTGPKGPKGPKVSTGYAACFIKTLTAITFAVLILAVASLLYSIKS